MKKGVVVFVDFLGIKGIWKKHDTKQVLEKLRYLRDNVLTAHLANGNSYLDEVRRNGGPSILSKAIFVSDTIAVAYWYDLQDEDKTPGALVYIIGKVMAELIREAASHDIIPSLILRGCITVGEFDFDENFLIGPAVDEAGAFYEDAHGAFVFLAPSAEKYLNEAINYLRHLVRTGETTREDACKSVEGLLFIPHEVSLKKGGKRYVPILNPLAGEDTTDQPKIIESIVSAFDDPAPKVKEKQQNTEDFLEVCSSFDLGPWL
jgi:hypothetical protein